MVFVAASEALRKGGSSLTVSGVVSITAISCVITSDIALRVVTFGFVSIGLVVDVELKVAGTFCAMRVALVIVGTAADVIAKMEVPFAADDVDKSAAEVTVNAAL